MCRQLACSPPPVLPSCAIRMTIAVPVSLLRACAEPPTVRPQSHQDEINPFAAFPWPETASNPPGKGVQMRLKLSATDRALSAGL